MGKLRYLLSSIPEGRGKRLAPSSVVVDLGGEGTGKLRHLLSSFQEGGNG